MLGGADSSRIRRSAWEEDM